MDGKAIDHNVMRSTSIFLVLYIGIFALSWLVLSLDQTDFVTNFTAVAANINNTGPGLEWLALSATIRIQYFVKNYFDFRYVSRQTRIVPVDVAVRPVSVEKIVSKLKRL